MTQEIIDIARQIGLQAIANYDFRGSYENMTVPEQEEFAQLLKFAKLLDAKATSKEREACALLAKKTVCDTHIPTGVKIYGTAVSKAIRARGEA